jgi:hypothetical protein
MEMQHASYEVETEFVNIIYKKFVFQRENIKICFRQPGCSNEKN